MNLYIGSQYNQICDSQGPHNKAVLTDLPDGTTQVKWLPTIRTKDESWDNIYIWDKKALDISAATTKLVYAVDVNVANLINLNTFEFEVQAVIGGHKYNLAWQFAQQSPYRASTFDFANKHWVQTFPLQQPALTAGKTARFEALYEILPTGPHHVGIQYNNTYVPVDVSRSWVKTDEGNYLNFAFQFDSLNKGIEIDATVNTRLVVC